MTVAIATDAPLDPIRWDAIHWPTIHDQVRRLQVRIAKVVLLGSMRFQIRSGISGERTATQLLLLVISRFLSKSLQMLSWVCYRSSHGNDRVASAALVRCLSRMMGNYHVRF